MRNDIYDFYALGLGEPLPISSVHGIGIDGCARCHRRKSSKMNMRKKIQMSLSLV